MVRLPHSAHDLLSNCSSAPEDLLYIVVPSTCCSWPNIHHLRTTDDVQRTTHYPYLTTCTHHSPLMIDQITLTPHRQPSTIDHLHSPPSCVLAWRCLSQEEIPLHKKNIYAMTYSNELDCLITGGEDGTVQVGGDMPLASVQGSRSVAAYNLDTFASPASLLLWVLVCVRHGSSMQHHHRQAEWGFAHNRSRHACADSCGSSA